MLKMVCVGEYRSCFFSARVVICETFVVFDEY